MIIGAIGGLLGTLFVKLNIQITKWRQKHIPKHNHMLRIAEVVVISVLTATLCYSITMLSPCAVVPNVQSFGQDTFNPYTASTLNINNATSKATNETNFIGPLSLPSDYEEFTNKQIENDFFRNLNCPEHKYNIAGQLFFTPLSEALKLLLHLGEGDRKTRLHHNCY